LGLRAVGLVPGWLLVGVVPLGGADNVTVKGFVVVFPARGLSDVLCEVGVTDAPDAAVRESPSPEGEAGSGSRRRAGEPGPLVGG
jgi:hypothetical protein